MKRFGKFRTAILIGIAAFVSAGTIAWACTCEVPPPTLEESFNDSDAVFYGKVIFKETIGEGNNGRVHYNFEVFTSWKGVTGKYVGISTSLQESLCGAPGIENGDELVVYAQALTESVFTCDPGELCIELCMRRGNILDIKGIQKGLGYEPLELTEDPDELYPPYDMPSSPWDRCIFSRKNHQ